jgi:uncharacterized alkaline shock family protein YloU
LRETAKVDQEAPRRGKTTIAPEALVTIAKLAALAVPGVARMGNVPARVNHWFKRGVAEGVLIQVADNAVTAELHVVVQAGQDVREVSRQVQAEVSRAMQEMVGMDVLAVNVFIDDIAYDGSAG